MSFRQVRLMNKRHSGAVPGNASSTPTVMLIPRSPKTDLFFDRAQKKSTARSPRRQQNSEYREQQLSRRTLRGPIH